MSPIHRLLIVLSWLALGGSGALAQTIELILPAGTSASSATATASGVGVRSDGTIAGGGVRFERLLPATPYDLVVVFADGTRWAGVSMRWHAPLPDEPPAGVLDEAGIAAIRELATKVPSFYNRVEMLHLHGDARRAVAVVQLVRDASFYGDRGGEIVWRVERWFYEFHAGGWSRVPQQADVLRRERFRSREAFDRDAGTLRWVPAMGGVSAAAGETKAIDLSGEPTTRPSR